MNTRPNSKTGEAQGEFQFECLHIPTGQRRTDWAAFTHKTGYLELDALRCVDSWNRQQPGVWQYWLVP